MQYLKSTALSLLTTSSLIALSAQTAYSKADTIHPIWLQQPADQATVLAQNSDTQNSDTQNSDNVPEIVPSLENNDPAEINDLPDSLSADPNPLAYPTVPEEVDVHTNPVITLEQAEELAYRNSQALQAAQLSLEQAEAAVREATAANLPTVSTDANLTNSGSDDQDTTVLGGNVSVDYDLLTGGSRSASIRAAQLEQQIAALVLESQQAEIKLATAVTHPTTRQKA